jgi:hypothetical protein
MDTKKNYRLLMKKKDIQYNLQEKELKFVIWASGLYFNQYKLKYIKYDIYDCVLSCSHDIIFESKEEYYKQFLSFSGLSTTKLSIQNDLIRIVNNLIKIIENVDYWSILNQLDDHPLWKWFSWYRLQYVYKNINVQAFDELYKRKVCLQCEKNIDTVEHEKDRLLYSNGWDFKHLHFGCYVKVVNEIKKNNNMIL